MGDMTLQEALQTSEVQDFLGSQMETKIQEALAGLPELVSDAVKTAITEQAPALRESVKADLDKDGEARTLHTEAIRLIEASKLTGAAKDNLLADYALTEAADGTIKPARGLTLIEAEVDAEGATTKSAVAVLREAVEDDIKRARNVLKEAAPSVPFAPGGGTDTGAPPSAQFLGADSPTGQMMRDKGLDPAQFGATPVPEPTTT